VTYLLTDIYENLMANIYTKAVKYRMYIDIYTVIYIHVHKITQGHKGLHSYKEVLCLNCWNIVDIISGNLTTFFLILILSLLILFTVFDELVSILEMFF
jgi:hypothetical protein